MEDEKNETLKETKRRKAEKKGRTVCVKLLSGQTIVGNLEDYDQSSLFVREFKEPQFVKDIRRRHIRTFLIMLDGGLNGE